MLSMAGIVRALATESVTVETYPRETFDSHGRVNARGAATTRTAQMSVQPTSGSDLSRLPEGLVSSETCALWSTVTLTNRDKVTCARGVFEVFHVEPWESTAGYCKALAKRLDPQE